MRNIHYLEVRWWLLAGFAVSLISLAYVGWCARPFYLCPRIRFSSNVPNVAKDRIQDWWETSSKPVPIEWDLFKVCLMNPTITDPMTAHVVLEDDDRILIYMGAEIDEFGRFGDDWRLIK
jgi:hypothetical protein